MWLLSGPIVLVTKNGSYTADFYAFKSAKLRAKHVTWNDIYSAWIIIDSNIFLALFLQYFQGTPSGNCLSESQIGRCRISGDVT